MNIRNELKAKSRILPNLIISSFILLVGKSSADTLVVEAIMAAAIDDANKLHERFRSDLDRRADKAVTALEQEKSNAIKKGDLAEANSIQAKITELKSGSLGKSLKPITEKKENAIQNDRADIPMSSVLNKKQILVVENLVSSRWIHANSFIYEFKKEMTFKLIGTGRYGTYSIDKEGNGFILKWLSDKGRLERGAISGAGVYTFEGAAFEKIKQDK